MDELKLYGLYVNGDCEMFIKFPNKPKICHFGIIQDVDKKYEISEIKIVKVV